MSTKKNYYEVLGVERGCSTAVIRKAYHTLARKYHPDVTLLEKSYAAYMMASISEAYKVLSDDAARSAYDAELDRPPAPQQPSYTQREGFYPGGSYGGRSGYTENSYSGTGDYGRAGYGDGAYGSSGYNGAGGYDGGYSSGSEGYRSGSYKDSYSYHNADFNARQTGGSYEESGSIPNSFSGKVFYVLGLLGAAAVNVVRQDPLIRKVCFAVAALIVLNFFMSFVFWMGGGGKSGSDARSAFGGGSAAASQNAGLAGTAGNSVRNTVENYKDNIKGFAKGNTDTDFYKFAGIEPYISYSVYKNMFPGIKLNPIDRVHNVSRYSCQPAFTPPFKGFPLSSGTVVGFDSSDRLCMVSYYFSPDDFTQVKNYYYAALGPFLKHKDTYFFKRGDFVVMLDPYSSEINKASLTFCVDIRDILKEE